jgi:anthranilate synthase/aminodeoxychorismate synthase-like glutamine amidotransferase
MTVLILDNYDSFTYNLFQMVQAQTSLEVQVFRNDALCWDDLLGLRPSHILLSPGPGHPGRVEDFGLCREVVLRYEELACPVLGVCLGHQGLAHYFGGVVAPAPEIMHGKTSPVRILKPSPLLEGLPNPFTVMRYHSWTVNRHALPEEFEVIAETDEAEPLVMAIRHRRQPLYGVQFHPESVGTPQGGQLLGNFLNLKPAGAPAGEREVSCPA